MTSQAQGHTIIFEDSQWIYEDGTPVHEAWNGRCSGDGQSEYIDGDGNRRYSDTGEVCTETKPRPCAKCGEYPTTEGDDSCLQHLGSVLNACCGHGSGEGYIMFDNGVTIRGYFKILRDDKPVIDNTIGTEIYVCKYCGQIYRTGDNRTRCGSCNRDIRNVNGGIDEYGVEYISTKR